MTALVSSVLDGSFSFMHVTRTTINSWMSLNFVKIPLLITELAALERLKNQYSVDHSSSFNFEWIFFILAGSKDNHKVSDEFEILPDQISDSGVSCL